MSKLFTPYTLRGMTLRNRTVVAPMCQYSAQAGVLNDWHFVHLGRFALGGFGLVILEATGVTPEARISYGDLGLWDDAQIPPLARVVQFLHDHQTAAGIQLAHAGRKAATPIGWRNGFDETEEEKPLVGFETWVPLAPSAIAHNDKPAYQTPRAMSVEDIAATVKAFADAAIRADKAGFDTVEIHGAHGYLINQFLSPLANHRSDDYGGSRDNRMRFALEVARAVREVFPADKPVLMRLSVTDGSEGGWAVEDSIVLAEKLKALGIDAIHASSGGFDGYSLKPGPLYQVPLASALQQAGMPSIAVGLIDDPQDAERILVEGDADLVAFARGALEDPNWPIHAHHILDGGGDAYDLWPVQARARIRDKDRALGRRTV